MTSLIKRFFRSQHSNLVSIDDSPSREEKLAELRALLAEIAAPAPRRCLN